MHKNLAVCNNYTPGLCYIIVKVFKKLGQDCLPFEGISLLYFIVALNFLSIIFRIAHGYIIQLMPFFPFPDFSCKLPACYITHASFYEQKRQQSPRGYVCIYATCPSRTKRLRPVTRMQQPCWFDQLQSNTSHSACLRLKFSVIVESEGPATICSIPILSYVICSSLLSTVRLSLLYRSYSDSKSTNKMRYPPIQLL